MANILTQLPDDHDPDKVYGAIARAEALAAGHPTWWELTEWPPDEEWESTNQPKDGLV